MAYQEKKFDLPELDGISKEGVEQHLGLYAGYVKNFNAMATLTGELMADPEKNSLAIAELIRRSSFEWDGMRLHEHYFSQWKGDTKNLETDSALGKKISEQFGSIENAVAHIKRVGSLRGPGWSIMYFDPQANQFLVGFSDQQHQGHFVTLPIILALDVWEHAYILDYGAAGRGKYIDAFFKNLNWEVMEKRFGEI